MNMKALEELLAGASLYDLQLVQKVLAGKLAELRRKLAAPGTLLPREETEKEILDSFSREDR